MYANLTVRVTKQNGNHEVYAAHQVDITPTGVLIHKDAQNGEGSYFIEAGVEKIAGARNIEITANF